MKTRMILEVIFIFIVASVGFRLGFIEGNNDANFDREKANSLLRSCNEVITHNKLIEG